MVTMLRYVTFLLFSILANCDKEFHRGHCPTPPKLTEDIKYEDADGVWYVVGTNYEGVKPGGKECFEGIITTVNGKHAMRLNFEGPGGKQDIYMSRHHDSKKGHLGGNYEDSTGKSVHWDFSILKHHGDTALMFVCEQVEKKHKTFHHVVVRSLPIDSAIVDEMKETYKETGDPRPMHSVDVHDCVWKWHN